MKHVKSSGFSLLELMIAVAIVGILAAVAYPMYTTHVQDTRRAECGAALLGLASAMERDFSRNNAYRNLVALGNFPNQCPTDGGGAFYTLTSAPTGGGIGFLLTATPAGAQAGDVCGALTLNQQLIKGQGGGTVDRCWR